MTAATPDTPPPPAVERPDSDYGIRDTTAETEAEIAKRRKNRAEANETLRNLKGPQVLRLQGNTIEIGKFEDPNSEFRIECGNGRTFSFFNSPETGAGREKLALSSTAPDVKRAGALISAFCDFKEQQHAPGGFSPSQSPGAKPSNNPISWPHRKGPNKGPAL